MLYIHTVYLLNLTFKWLIALLAKAMPLYKISFSECSAFTKLEKKKFTDKKKPGVAGNRGFLNGEYRNLNESRLLAKKS